MQEVTVGTKNQIVIPKEIRQQIKGLKPGSKVKVYRLDSDTIAVKLDAEDWYESTHGMMKEAWAGIDPIKELEKMRDEW